MTKVENVYSVGGVLIEGIDKAYKAQCESDLLRILKTKDDHSVIETLVHNKCIRAKVIEVLLEMEDLV